MNKENDISPGIQGWLLTLCIYNSVIIPFFYFVLLYFFLFENINIIKNSQDNFQVYQYTFLFLTIISVLSFISGILIWMQKQYSISFYKYTLVLALFLQITSSIMSLNFYNEITFYLIFDYFKFYLQIFAFFIIPWLFLKYSTRVKITFIDRKENNTSKEIQYLIISISFFIYNIFRELLPEIFLSIFNKHIYFTSLNYEYGLIFSYLILSIYIPLILDKITKRKSFFLILPLLIFISEIIGIIFTSYKYSRITLFEAQDIPHQ